jgi:hypothetical protein
VPSYLVERYLPGLSPAEVHAAVQRLRTVTEQMTAEGTPIRYLSSAYLAEEESCFCQLEAPSREAVAAATERATFPYAHIHAVRLRREQPYHEQDTSSSAGRPPPPPWASRASRVLWPDKTLRDLLHDRLEEHAEVHHTDCGMLTFGNDDFRRQIQRDTGVKPEWPAEAFDDLDDDVRQSIARVKASPFIPNKDQVRGFVYDVETGQLREVT